MSIYKVHSRHDAKTDVAATLPDGTEVTAQVDCAIIELVGDDGFAVTLRKLLSPAGDKEKIDAVFKPGNTVQMGEFTLVKESA